MNIVSTMKNKNRVRGACIVGFFVVLCSLFTLQAVVADNNDTIAAAIYQRTEVKATDSAWAKYVKDAFAEGSKITSSTSSSAITWAEVPTSGVSKPWDGSKLSVTATLPTTHTPGTNELVAETVTDGSGIKTVTYTKYTAAATPGDPDTAEVQLKTMTGTAVTGAPNYHIYTAEALAYVMQQFATNNPGTAFLEKDIDLNGRNHNWFNVRMAQGQDFDGQNHTIYNLSAINNEKNSTSSRSGFICVADSGCEVTNVKFDTAYIVGTHYSGIIGYMNDSGSPNKIENVHVKDVITAITSESINGQAGALAGRVEGASTVKNCSAENCLVYGGDHVGSLTAAVVGKGSNAAKVENCFSVGCKVYSTGSHSGGLISCGGTVNIKNCFTDVELYGSDRTGVFTGVLNGDCNVENCYASGFIEGSSNIGGFLGFLEYISGGTDVTVKNCYSTALTGLRTDGTRLGGFIGATDTRATTATFTNCYAAGEVGSVDTDVTPPAGGDYTVDQPQQNGGFIGYQASDNIVYENCYYDKQTTAMREWAVGHSPAGVDRSGIKGVLTTDTDKSGNGLVSSDFPKGTGFTKFPEEDSSQAKWGYSIQQHYPILEVFQNATADEWITEDLAAIVRAYSLSSTSTMHLETWEKGLDTATGEMTTDLPETTYCTVRDLTSGFTLTAEDVEKWERIKTQDNEGTGEAKTNILGKEIDVLSLKHQNGVWLCDELVPGVEWLKVTCKDGDQTATRRVRVIPTAGLDAGNSTVAIDKYDHADDVELYYSTATRMAQNMDDITTGIFPDKEGAANAITARQTALMNNVAMDGDNDKYRDANVNYMSSGDDNAKDGKLYVYVYPVTGFNSDTNEIQTGSLLDFDDNGFAAKFNGYEEFEPISARYLITYKWVLNDGRVIQDAKIIRCPEMPFDVTLDLYKNSIADENLYSAGGHLYVGIDNKSGNKPILTDFTGFDTKGEIKAVDSGLAEFKENAQTAWKLVDSNESIKSITLTISYSDTEEYSTTISGSDIVDGKVISVPCVERRIVYENGKYYTIPETVTREYTLKHNTAEDTWYLNFEKQNEKTTSTQNYDFYLNDVENDIRVDVVVNSNKEGYTITGTKTLTGDKTTFKEDQFSFELVESPDNDTSGYTGFTGKAKLSTNGTITFDTLTFSKPGEYVFTANETGQPAKGYTYDKDPVTITCDVTQKEDGGMAVTARFEKKNGDTSVVFANKYSKEKKEDPGKIDKDKDKGVNTGDNSQIILFSILAACALLALIIVLITSLRRKK